MICKCAVHFSRKQVSLTSKEECTEAQPTQSITCVMLLLLYKQPFLSSPEFGVLECHEQWLPTLSTAHEITFWQSWTLNFQNRRSALATPTLSVMPADASIRKIAGSADTKNKKLFRLTSGLLRVAGAANWEAKSLNVMVGPAMYSGG